MEAETLSRTDEEKTREELIEELRDTRRRLHALTALQKGDICEQKTGRQIEEFYQVFLDSTADMVFLKNSSLKYIYINKANAEFFGKSPEEILGKDDSQLMPPEAAEKCRRTDLMALNSEDICVHEETVGERTYETHKFRVNLKDAGAGVGAFIRDVTDRRKSEDTVKAALMEKETMLEKIHHRVNNNMQIISSLINIQAHYTDIPELKEAFWETQSRIRTMSMLHERLHRTGSLSRVDFGDYLRDIITSLFRTYRKSNISYTIDADLFMPDIKSAIPLGLIVNELISHSIRHSFPDNMQGNIHVTLHLSDADNVVLTIEDDGIGMSEGFNLQSPTTISLSLARDLVSQLDGDLKYKNSQGSSFTIRFRKDRSADKDAL
ncbi:MAG: sensor histidine kinase [Candidatus Xenobiia bacterium LiM19]